MINSGSINSFVINAAAGAAPIPQYSMPVTLTTNGAEVALTIPMAIIKGDVISRRFLCMFQQTALDDLPVVIKSISGTLNTDGTSRLAIVVPLADGVESAITPYLSGGTFTLEFQDIYQDSSVGSSYSEVLTIDSVRVDTGASSASLTVGGFYTTPNTTPAILALKGVSFKVSQADGKTRFRCELDRDFKAGDIATYEGISLTTTQVTYIITPFNQYMEVVG